jgi:hypothetical protein
MQTTRTNPPGGRHTVVGGTRRRTALGGAHPRRPGVITLELIISIPVLVIILLAIYQIALIMAASRHVEFASRLGAKVAAEVPRSGGPPDLENLTTLKGVVDGYLTTAGYSASCTVLLEHNAVGVPNPLQTYSDGMDCPCGPTGPNPLPDTPSGVESVRVTVCLPMAGNIPNCLSSFGFDLADCAIQHSTVWRIETNP